jgi:glutamate synthase domain-containing protein 2
MHHSIAPKPAAREPVRILIGGADCNRPYSASAFNISAMSFGSLSANAEMRRLAGGKPAGFKLCVGHPWEVLALVKAMLETGITPDFIVVDGTEGGTGPPRSNSWTISACRSGMG